MQAVVPVLSSVVAVLQLAAMAVRLSDIVYQDVEIES